MRKFPGYRNGFTLIELLVVIAIIAILAAILFPVFAQARASARKASCLSNIKQNALAYLMYADDYDEKVVPYLAQWDSPDGTKTVWWHQNLDPYTKNRRLWQCTEQSQWNEMGAVCAANAGGILPNQCGFMRIQHYYLTGGPGTGTWDPTTLHVTFADGAEGAMPSVGSFNNPSDVIIFGESNCSFACDFLAHVPKNVSETIYTYYHRHNDASNLAFADGHAKTMKPERLGRSSWCPLTPPQRPYPLNY